MFNITSENEKRFEGLIESVMTAGNAAGLTCAVISPSGEIARLWQHGFRDAEQGLPITTDTIFGLASVTKSFTALSIMQLEEAGKLSLDDPISKYIPEFTNKNQPRPVRIRHLLSHSGGFYPLKRILMAEVAASMGFDQQKDGDFSYNSALEAEGTRLVARRLDNQTDLIGLPGDMMSYCNDGFGLLSHIVMEISGEPSFADYVKNHILVPLGMERSSCDFLAPHNDPNSAVIYNVSGGERVISDNLDNAFVLNGGGAMKSTMADMAKYIAMYLNEGATPSGRFISRRAVREMVKPRQTMAVNSYYGYGLMINPLRTTTVIRHGGSLAGVSSHMAWSYEGGFGVMVLCNTSGVAVSAIADGLIRLCLGLDPLGLHETYIARAWRPAFIERISGRYASTEGADFTISASKEGHPVLTDASGVYPLTVISPSRAIFRRAFDDVAIEILQDERRGVFAIRNGTRIVPKCR